MTDKFHSSFQKVLNYYQQGRLEEAEKLCRHILEENPSYGEALHWMGFIAAQSGKTQEAVGWLERASESLPENPVIHNHLANAYQRCRRQDEAERHYLLALQYKPDYAEAHNNLGGFYDKLNHYEKALEHYAKAVNLQPDYMAAHQNLGVFFLKNQQYDEAIKQFNNVLQLEPETLTAHYHLGNLYLERGQLDLAETHYNAALSLDPEHENSLNNLGVVYLKKEVPQLAIDYFTRALALNNNNKEAQSNIAATFMQYERYENAARHYRELLRHEPNSLEYHYNIGVAYMALGHLNEAIVHFEQVLAQSPEHAATLSNLGAVYWRLNKKKKAEDFFESALKIDPDNTSNRYMLSAILQKQDYDKAPQFYIQHLFDHYALGYDKHMYGRLDYRVPQEMEKMLKTYSRPESQWITLDLGCGTGLLGSVLKPFSNYLIGVDLSEKMLEHAKKTSFYDVCYQDEILNFLAHETKCFDCIAAAEVLEYFGDLNRLFSQVSSHLNAQGWFIFSIEIQEKKAAFFLQASARFAHNPSYIQMLAQSHHFNLIASERVKGRLHEGKPLEEQVFLLQAF